MKKLLLGLLISASGYSNFTIDIDVDNGTKKCEYDEAFTPNTCFELANSKVMGFTHCIKTKLLDGITAVMCDEPSTMVWFFADNFAICQKATIQEILKEFNKKIEMKNGVFKIKK